MALCQFDLTRCFGYPYTKDKGAGWGAPIVDHAITLDENPPRSTVAKDYEFIISTLEVNKPFGESTVAKILDLVENSSSKKAKAENFITKFARYYTPAVVFAALAQTYPF